MKSFIQFIRSRAVLPALLLTALLAPPAALATQAASPTSHVPARSAASQWISYSPVARAARLTLISAYGQDTYNFNGASNGHLKVTVPLGSKVVVTYTNQSKMMPHGAEVVKWNGTLPTGSPPAPAFAGAASPNYLHGTSPGVTQTFSFTASRAGKYLLICPVHNHVKYGHWAWFIVSKTATTATAVIK